MNTSTRIQKDLSRDLPPETRTEETATAQTCTDAGSPAAETEGRPLPTAAEVRRRLELGGATLRFCCTLTRPNAPFVPNDRTATNHSKGKPMSHRFTLPAALTLPAAAGGLLLLTVLQGAAQTPAGLQPLVPNRLISSAPLAPNTDFGPAPAPREPRVIMPQPLTTPVALAHPLNLSGPRLTLSGHHVPLQDQSVQTGPVDAGQTMSVMFALKPRNQAVMDDLARRVYDPKDPLYRHFLSRNERVARFSPTEEDVRTVAAFAQQSGLAVTDISPDRQLVTVTGPIGTIQSALGIRLHNYQAPDGQAFFAPDRDPAVPAAVAPLLSGVMGLSNADRPHSYAISRPVSQAPAAGVEPNDIGVYVGTGLPAAEVRKVYDMTVGEANGAAVNGVGQTVALVEFGGYQQSDIDSYIYYNSHTADPGIGLRTIPIQPILLGGDDGSLNSDSLECELDIEMLEAAADGLAQINVYETNSTYGTLGTLDILNRIADDDTASEVSISYGVNESTAGSFYQSTYDGVTEELTLQGQSVFVSSGDSGAYSGTSSLTVNTYAASPWVTGVGGTSLTINQNIFSSSYGDFSSESVWNNDNGASGGGVSQYVPLPDYQANYLSLFPNSLNSPASTTNRNVPDVALDSDLETGYFTHVYDSNLGYSADEKVGGTSAAAPLWAAAWAQLNQARADLGYGTLGFANPALYSIAEGANYNTGFHDVTSYNNNYYQAETGYDNATGLGSMDDASLLNELVNYGAFPVVTATLAGQNVALSGESVPLTVTLSSPVPNMLDATVTINQLKPDGTLVPAGTGEIGPGSSSTSVSITLPDVNANPATLTYDASIIYSDANGPRPNTQIFSSNLSVGVYQNELYSLGINPASVFSTQQATGTITLTEPAAVNEVVDLSSSVPAAASFPATVTVLAGQQSATFPITATVVSAATSVTLTATHDASSGLGNTVQPASFTVTPQTKSQTALTSSVNPAALGSAVTFTAKVTGSAPTGSVTFTLGGVAQPAVPLNVNGTATFTTSSLPAGSTVVSAAYSGDAPNSGSVSGTLTETITALTNYVRFFPRIGQEKRMVGGLFQGSTNNTTWTTLATETQVPPSTQYSILATGADPATFRYLRYLAPNGAYGNVAEIEFDSHGIKLTGTGFGTTGSYNNDGNTFQKALDGSTGTYFDAPAPGNGDFVGIDRGATYTKLSGTAFGTAGSYNNDGNTFKNVFDGNLSTYFDAPAPGNGDFAGIDLGAGHAATVTRIGFSPRSGYGNRMVGGVFQGSNDNSNWTTLSTVTSAPPTGVLTETTISNGTAFRYLRYLAPNGAYGNVAEVEFDTSP